jgi:hypothetical protein
VAYAHVVRLLVHSGAKHSGPEGVMLGELGTDQRLQQLLQGRPLLEALQRWDSVGHSTRTVTH